MLQAGCEKHYFAELCEHEFHSNAGHTDGHHDV
jgi:hypothetical protein